MFGAIIASTKSTPASVQGRPFVCLACRLQSSLTKSRGRSTAERNEAAASERKTRSRHHPNHTVLHPSRDPSLAKAPFQSTSNGTSIPYTTDYHNKSTTGESSPTDQRRYSIIPNKTRSRQYNYGTRFYAKKRPSMPEGLKEGGLGEDFATKTYTALSSHWKRHYHSSASSFQEINTMQTGESIPHPFSLSFQSIKPGKSEGIRAQLRQWQEQNGDEHIEEEDIGLLGANTYGGTLNGFSRLQDERTSQPSREDIESDQDATDSYLYSESDNVEPEQDLKFLRTGDLVEIDHWGSERESSVAVFVRRIGHIAQLYNHHGRWIHVKEKLIQWSIPAWIDSSQVEPLLNYLPDDEDVSDMSKLMEEAYINDMSVPRTIAAPLVTKLVEFYNEAKEIYRKNAESLDNAHEILAHETNLRYGSLPSLASKLLEKPVEKLSLTALYAVRQALVHSEFAFEFDRRSHRLTGHLQIRSKDQTNLVHHVRDWLREWQECLAKTAAMTEAERERFVPPRRAGYVFGFIEKSRKIVLNSRKNRLPTPLSTTGPSKNAYPIEPDSDCIRYSTDPVFTQQETLIVRFMETWACTSLFRGEPRILALPPLILQAIGLYEEYGFRDDVGAMFLQEIGTILPFQNRLIFDQHLLLPSSRHSKPLHSLMKSLEGMQHDHDLRDSMKDLRHDWGTLPVYCIDEASALEIDDGVSIETANDKGEYWVHVHIANPTAFFSPDHPLARMARHMGESLYMPDKNYMMLPRWVGEHHLSLGKDRPCLTFSARVDEHGHTLEHKITPGIVRNVKQITPDEVNTLLGFKSQDHHDEMVLTVGGQLPPHNPRVSGLDQIAEDEIPGFKTLERFATQRTEIRSAAGGLFYVNNQPETKVWQSWSRPGLTEDEPYHLGSREVNGDPILQLRTRPLRNHFSGKEKPGSILVREMMLLACEIAATWCAERQIPTVFRGSVARPDSVDSKTFFREEIAPAVARSPTGDIPMHLGVQYLSSFGSTQLATKPLPHRILGMKYYAKATSPLRRYGDMILHWQIEAALREEAATGKSLVTRQSNARRSFLPFSSVALKSIIRSLGPREIMITRTKSTAARFWGLMALFRAFHFGQGTLSQPPPISSEMAELGEETPNSPLVDMSDLPLFLGMGHFPRHPSSPLPRRLKVYFLSDPTQNLHIKFGPIGVVVEFHMTANMILPSNDPQYTGGETAVKRGDTWEVEMVSISPWQSKMLVRPIKLIDRVV